MTNQVKKSPVKTIFSVIVGVIMLILVGMNVGINDAGYRTVIQYPNGTMSVKFEPGVYFPLFGKTTVWPDYLTYDFSADDGNCEFQQNDGVKVRYQDGGEGVVCGMANVQLPVTDTDMISFHKRYRTEDGARAKLLNQSFPKAMNLTAALMSSEEAYATKRSEFIKMSTEQAKKGLYVTKLEEKLVQVGIDEDGNPEMQKRDVPVIQMIKGSQTPQTQGSDFDKYSANIVQFDLKAWDFEAKTLKQIADKRSAEMAIITSKANAKKAYFAEQQVIAEGKKAVANAEYKAKTIAETQIQQAEMHKKLALIEASRVKEKAVELTLAAVEATKQKKQEALQAVEEAKVITTLAKANSFKIQKEQEAGELKLRLDNSVLIAETYSRAIAQMNVPTVMMVGGAEGGKGGDGDMQKLLQLQVLKSLGGITPTVNQIK